MLLCYLIVIFVVGVLVFRWLYKLYKMASFCNLATISEDSLRERLKCTGGSTKDVFEAVSRHARLWNGCGQTQVSYDCWSKVFDTQPTTMKQKLDDMRFLANWCGGAA